MKPSWVLLVPSDPDKVCLKCLHYSKVGAPSQISMNYCDLVHLWLSLSAPAEFVMSALPLMTVPSFSPSSNPDMEEELGPFSIK